MWLSPCGSPQSLKVIVMKLISLKGQVAEDVDVINAFFSRINCFNANILLEIVFLQAGYEHSMLRIINTSVTP